jgi:excisionase family DNA binding protein
MWSNALHARTSQAGSVAVDDRDSTSNDSFRLENRLALRPAEAAKALGVSENHFNKSVLPQLPVVRSGRCILIPRTSLEAWLDDNSEEAVGDIDSVVADLLGVGG